MTDFWYGGGFHPTFDPQQQHDFQLVRNVPPDATLLRSIIYFDAAHIVYQLDTDLIPQFEPTWSVLYWRSGFNVDTPLSEVDGVGDDSDSVMDVRGVSWATSLSHDGTAAIIGGGGDPESAGTRIQHYNAPSSGLAIDVQSKFRVARLGDPETNALWWSIGVASSGSPAHANGVRSFNCNASHRTLFLRRDL